MLVISVHGKNDLFLITGSKAKVSMNFSPKNKRSFFCLIMSHNGDQVLLSLFSFNFVQLV